MEYLQAGMGRKRDSMLLFISVMILAVFMCVGCGNDDAKVEKKAEASDLSKALPVKAVKVEQKTMPVYAEFVGQTSAKEVVDIRARVAGFLQERVFKEGSMVKKGELLFIIDPKEYSADLEKAKGELESNKASLAQARKDQKRYKALVDQGAISQDEYDQIATTEKQHKASVQQSEAAVKNAQLNLGYTKIYSPIDGQIGKALVNVGSLVGQGENTKLATVNSIDPIYVNFSLTEKQLLFYQKLQKKRQKEEEYEAGLELLLSDGSTYDHKGKGDMADPTVDSTMGTLGVRAVFPNPDHLLIPGQFAKVRVLVQKINNALVVPLRALVDVQGKKFVYVVGADNTLKSIPVTTGLSTKNSVVVEKGLEAGEIVVADGVQKLKAGVLVKPQLIKLKDKDPQTQSTKQAPYKTETDGAPATK